jgi:hypothetical protein
MSFATRVDRLKREYGRPVPGAATIEAVDFITGGGADFARACSLRGEVIEIIRRIKGEPYSGFIDRARSLNVGLSRLPQLDQRIAGVIRSSR